MLYEDPTKDVTTDERFHVELHFSPGVNCCVQKELVPGPGFRQVPHTAILEYFDIKNKHFLILPSSLSTYSSAAKTKRIFQML